ncbi:MAG: carboxypeptidase-like regulatory domain-containing protein, partial [Marinoscillum sp.]
MERQIVKFVCIFLLGVSHSFAWAQSTISGAVTDPAGDPLIGATVQVKGENTGTVTDIDGNFKIQVNQGQSLIISMIGMESQEIIVENFQPISLQLKEATSILGEVVVTGFQEVNRKLFTGASESLKMEDIKVNGLSDVSRALEGQVAGVNVDNVSGTFGTTPKIRVR